MTKHPQLTLDISKISLCNDASGRIWGTEKDLVTWDNCIQYSALKPGEFLQFKNGSTGWRWLTDPPTPESRPEQRNNQVLQVRLANDQNVFSAPQRWRYQHAYYHLGNSNVFPIDTGNKHNGITSDHRFRLGPHSRPNFIKNVKLQFKGSDRVWRDEQPDPVPGWNIYTMRVVGEGDKNEGGFRWSPRSFRIFYLDFKSLKVDWGKIVL